MAWNTERDKLLYIYIYIYTDRVYSQCRCEWTLCGAIDAGLAPDVWPPLWHAVHRSDSIGQVCVEVAYCCKLGLGMLDIRIAIGMGADEIASSAGRGSAAAPVNTFMWASHQAVASSGLV